MTSRLIEALASFSESNDANEPSHIELLPIERQLQLQALAELMHSPNWDMSQMMGPEAIEDKAKGRTFLPNNEMYFGEEDGEGSFYHRYPFASGLEEI